MSFDKTYYTGTILPIIVFKWKDVDNAIQITQVNVNESNSETNLNPDGNCVSVFASNTQQCSYTNTINTKIELLRNNTKFYTYINHIQMKNDYSKIRDCCPVTNPPGTPCPYIMVVCILSETHTVYSGSFDKLSTKINNIYGDCINTLDANDTQYSFTNYTIENKYKGEQSNNWNIGNLGGWYLSTTTATVDENTQNNITSGGFTQILIQPFGNSGSYKGTVQSRYYYTPFNTMSTAKISDFINYITQLPTTKIGQTDLAFSQAPCYPYFAKSTILYFFLNLFYSQLYQISTNAEFNLFANKDALSSSDRSKYLSQIQTLYESATGSLIVNSVSNTVVSSTVFTSFCMFPQVYFDTDSSVLIQVALPVSILMSTFTTDTVTTPTEFYKLTFSNQQKVLITIMRNFIQDNNGDYFTSYPDISNHHPLLPAEYELIQYDSTNPTAGYTDLLTCISALSNAGNTVQINLNQTAKPGTIYTNPSVYTKAYSICNDTSTVAPFCLYGLFNLKVKKWSVKLAAYCSQQFSNSTVPNSSSVLSVLPFLLLPNIYNKIAMDTSPTGDGLHGWILNDYYNYLTTNKAFDLYLGLLSNDCNSYFKSDGTPYYGISPYFLTPTGGIYNQSQLDCMCYHSLVAPKNVDSSGQKAAMCYDQHCYNSALPDPSPVLTAFGLTPTICADAQNCSAVNTFMTNTATDRTQNPSFLDNTLYTKNCGSLYTFNQSTRNTTIIWIGLGCLVIATLFTYLISSLLRASAFIVTLLCLLIIAVFAFLTYYGSSYLKGRWTCSSFGNKREQVESKPICVSVQNPDQVLPEECCQGEVTTSCECAVDQDCACAGGASQCNSGQCDYTEGSTKKRTSQTVTVNQPAVFSIAFMILLTISLPLIADLYLRLKKWHLNGVAYGILVLILMGVPLFFAVQFSSRTIQKNMFTDSCAV